METSGQLLFEAFKLSRDFRLQSLGELRARHALELTQTEQLLRVYQPRLKYDHSLAGNCAVVARQPGAETYTVWVLGPSISAGATHLKRFELVEDPEQLLHSLGYERRFAAVAQVAHCRISPEQHVLVLQTADERPALLLNLSLGGAAPPFEHVNGLLDTRRERLGAGFALGDYL